MRYLIVLITISWTASYAQETKFILSKEGGYNEEFYVLASDKTTKHGTYVKYKNDLNSGITIFESGNYENGKKHGKWDYYYAFTVNIFTNKKVNSLRETGHFVNDKKNGIWITYHPEPEADKVTSQKSEKGRGAKDVDVNIDNTDLRPMLAGQFLNDKRVGEWVSFDISGKIHQVYNYSKSVLIKDLSIQDTLNYNLNRRALYLGGEQYLIYILNNSLDQSFIKQLSKDTTSVIVSFDIEKNGQLINAKVDSSNGSLKMEMESLKAIESLVDWLPAVHNGEPAISQYKIAFRAFVNNFGRPASPLRAGRMGIYVETDKN